MSSSLQQVVSSPLVRTRRPTRSPIQPSRIKVESNLLSHMHASSVLGFRSVTHLVVRHTPLALQIPSEPAPIDDLLGTSLIESRLLRMELRG